VGSGNIEDGKLPFAHFQMMRHVLYGVFIGEFADPQKRAAAVFVAGGIAAFGIDMKIAEMNVGGMVQTNGGGKGARERVTR